MRNTRSVCSRPGCADTAHVVLYAAGGDFDGITYRTGQDIAFCLMHGGQVYDAIHDRRYAPWLREYRGLDLPTVRARWHNQVASTNRPNPTGRPAQAKTSRGKR